MDKSRKKMKKKVPTVEENNNLASRLKPGDLYKFVIHKFGNVIDHHTTYTFDETFEILSDTEIKFKEDSPFTLELRMMKNRNSDLVMFLKRFEVKNAHYFIYAFLETASGENKVIYFFENELNSLIQIGKLKKHKI